MHPSIRTQETHLLLQVVNKDLKIQIRAKVCTSMVLKWKMYVYFINTVFKVKLKKGGIDEKQ